MNAQRDWYATENPPGEPAKVRTAPAGEDLAVAVVSTRAARTAPWLVLAIGLILTAFAYHMVRSESRAVVQDRFDIRYSEIEEAIEQRMHAYTQALVGGLGLLRASFLVQRDDWRTYVETLNLQERYPGIQGVGFAEWVTPEGKALYEAEIRSQGFPDFEIRPTDPRELYSSITFLEPFDERNRQAFGFDMYSEATRRAAMELARDSGRYAMSGAVRLVQEITDDVQAGFLLYVPYYGRGSVPETLEDRRARSIGFVYSAFRMRDLMEGILGPGLPDVRLEIFDGTALNDDTLMYDSGQNTDDASPEFSHAAPLQYGQHTWTLRLTSLKPLESLLDPQKSLFVLAGGVAVSLLFFGVLRSFATMRARAETLAARMTATIEERNADLARSNAELEQFAYIASHDLKAPLRGIDHLAVWIENDLGDRLEGEPKENMGLLRGRVRRLDALLNDLLSYSRATRMQTALEAVDIEDAIREAFDMVSADRAFTLSLDLEVPSIVLRRSALDQVMTNLFSNAMKHHDGEVGSVTVTLRDRGANYEFTVADDGPGIPEKLRERALQMFQTLQPRDKVEGSGMGLAIIKKIIEHQGGTISIEDAPDGGALFRFSWPKAGKGDQN